VTIGAPAPSIEKLRVHHKLFKGGARAAPSGGPPMTERRKDLSAEPPRAGAVLARLVDAGSGVGFSIRLFSVDERNATAWLTRKGWAKAGRGRVAGQRIYEATAAGREEHARRLARRMDAAIRREHPELAHVAQLAAAQLCTDPSHKSGDCPRPHDSCPMCGRPFAAHRAPCDNAHHWHRAMGELLAARTSKAETPDLLDRCTCGHDYGTHDGRARCGRCDCKRFERAERKGPRGLRACSVCGVRSERYDGTYYDPPLCFACWKETATTANASAGPALHVPALHVFDVHLTLTLRGSGSKEALEVEEFVSAILDEHIDEERSYMGAAVASIVDISGVDARFVEEIPAGRAGAT
jgi:hypothetical protein